ncbi:MAG: hypothetical protein KIT14_14645 [bacterium]|nr:hypothetical protein [bacterium]
MTDTNTPAANGAATHAKNCATSAEPNPVATATDTSTANTSSIGGGQKSTPQKTACHATTARNHALSRAGFQRTACRKARGTARAMETANASGAARSTSR